MAGPEPIPDPNAALEQTLGLLKARDNTSKFVGLSLLRSLLDTNEQWRTDAGILTKCWRSISNNFLMRLMNSQPTKKSSVEETKSMIELAVSVVHLFANLLPPDELANEKMTDFCSPLVHILPSLDQDPQTLVFQTLQCIASLRLGAVALATVNDWTWLSEASTENPEYYFKEVARLFAVSQKSGPMEEYELGKWHGKLEILIQGFQKKDESGLIETLAELTTEFPVSSIQSYPLF
jgi:hypothetical protein